MTIENNKKYIQVTQNSLQKFKMLQFFGKTLLHQTNEIIGLYRENNIKSSQV